MERKHIMAIERSLSMVSRKIEKEDNKIDFDRIGKSLQRIERDISKGPMRKIFEACAADLRIEVPIPPTRPLIQVKKLSAYVHQLRIGSRGDDAYLNTKKIYLDAINLCDTSKSRRFGAELRLSLSSMLLNWNDVDKVQDEISVLLKWITDNAGHFNDIVEKVKQLKETMSKEKIAEVVKAMNVIDGYDYGGSW